MTKRLFFTGYLPVPVFLKLSLEKEVITLSSYEELALPAPETPKSVLHSRTEDESGDKPADPPKKLGRITGLPGGYSVPRYNIHGLKKIISEMTDPSLSKEPSKIDGKTITRAKDNRREIIQGDSLDRSLKGREFVHLSSAALSKQDLDMRGEWKDLSVWLFEIDSSGMLHTPHNLGLLIGGLGARSPRVSRVLDRINALTVYQTYAKAPFTECSFLLKANVNYGFSAPQKSAWKQVTWKDISDISGKFMPQLRLVSSAKTVGASTPSVLEVEAFDPNTGKVVTDFPMTLELTARSGYLPQTRIPLKKGRAEFRVMGLGLEKGETVQLTAGLGYSPDLLDIQLTVS